MDDLSIYIHWPFCKAKCPYCDFNSHVQEKIKHDEWLKAYVKELDYFAARLPNRRVKTIYFGGGTPSLMEPEVTNGILEKIRSAWNVADDVEITLEANPTSVEAEKFRQFKAAGVNRVSLGLQALNDADLKFLGRQHSVAESLNALEIAKATFAEVSFDLIYARPGQSISLWEKELRQAMALAKSHLSLYQLTIEKGTQFYSTHKNGGFTMPEDAISADLYALTEDITKSHNFIAYEVSNYAVPGHESRHNLCYWQSGEYLGIGPGAHSRIDMGQGREAIMMLHRPEKWLQQVFAEGHGVQSRTPLTVREFFEEFVMMGLRLETGISMPSLRQNFGEDFAQYMAKERLADLAEEGMIEFDDDNLKSTKKGRLLLNSIITHLLTGGKDELLIERRNS